MRSAVYCDLYQGLNKAILAFTEDESTLENRITPTFNLFVNFHVNSLFMCQDENEDEDESKKTRKPKTK